MGLVRSKRRQPRRGDRQGAGRGRPPEVDHRRGQELRRQEEEPRGKDRSDQQAQDEPARAGPPDGRGLQGPAGPRLADGASRSAATCSPSKGKTLRPNAVATYLENLKKSPFFAEPVFKNLGREAGPAGHLQLGDDLIFKPTAGRPRGGRPDRRRPRSGRASGQGRGRKAGAEAMAVFGIKVEEEAGTRALASGLPSASCWRPSTQYAWIRGMNDRSRQDGRSSKG